eukprot:scaffold23920_cov101-Isochrysis_galbana.AAC.1
MAPAILGAGWEFPPPPFFDWRKPGRAPDSGAREGFTRPILGVGLTWTISGDGVHAVLFRAVEDGCAVYSGATAPF